MADCFSLPNEAELVKRLRATANVYYEDSSVLYLAADAIEQLMQMNNRLVEQNKELAEAYRIIGKLKAERDAAVNDLTFSYKHQLSCFTCKHDFGESAAERCIDCEKYSEWVWRGVQNDETN